MTQSSPRILRIATSSLNTLINAFSEWSVETVTDGDEAMMRLDNASFDVVLIEPPLPQWSIEDLIDEIARLRTGTPIVIRDPLAGIRDAARYTRLGAFDVTSVETDTAAAVESAVEFRRRQQGGVGQDAPWRSFLVGSSRAMSRTTEIIRLVACRRSTVLINGETGTGKEMVARAIHVASPRANMPMVAVNCNALPENLLEAELFGHVKGAFTGAIQQRIGRFEQAHRGTLFLDEVGDLPLDIQTKLLRVLQEREFQRIGSSETIRVDVRLIAATNVDLVSKIREGGFREDLYYRLNVVPISTPPLRDRTEDIPSLVAHFLTKICNLEGIAGRRVSPETLSRLTSYSWPGNVRQLENAVENAIALSGDREILYPSDFPLQTNALSKAVRTAHPSIALPETGMDFEQTVGNIERDILIQALQRAGCNKTAAAEMLGLKRTTLAAKLRSLEAGVGS